MVKPMMIETQARGGQNLRIPIEVRNNGGEGEPAQELETILLDLTQTRSGSWQPVMEGKTGDNPVAASSRPWMSLKQDGLTLKAMEIGIAEVMVKIPRDARGYYFSALLVRQKPQPGTSVNFAFLIPIIIEVKGAPLRQNVQLGDVGLTYLEATTSREATTEVSLDVANPGRTFSKLNGRIRVDAYVKDRWIKVTETDAPKVNIMPGVNLHLAADINKRLPSGRYRLTGALLVDGRRLKPLEKEIDFTGDPAMNTLAVDQALILNPPELFITSVSGGMRTSVLQLENASADTVEIDTASAQPPTLRGVAMGDLVGDRLSCDKWIRISPARFRIRGGGKQNVRVVTNIPRELENFPNYYGLLQLTAHYPDGQSAGETSALVCLNNKTVENTYAAKIIDHGLIAAEDGKYIIKARAANIGNVHYIPGCSTRLETGIGGKAAEAALSGDTTLMLPMSVRDYAGEMDFSKVEPGTYRLVTTFEMGQDNQVQDTLGLDVSDKDGVREVNVIETPPAAAEGEGQGNGDAAVPPADDAAGGQTAG